MAAETGRSASGYEEQLRRHELAAGRALMQVLPAGEPPTAGQLAEARRALTRALRDLRGLKRELELDLRRLQGGERPEPGGRGAQAGRAEAGRAPGSGRGQAGRAEIGRPPGGRGQAGRAEGGRPPGGRGQAGRAEAGRAQAGRAQAGRAEGGRAQAGGGSRASRRRPEELYRYEAAANAIDEVLERWEARRVQLTSEIERRGTRRR